MMSTPECNDNPNCHSNAVCLPRVVLSPPSATETSGQTEAPLKDTITTSVLISNLHCGSCSYTINHVLWSLSPPPVFISCNILTHEVTIKHSPELAISEIVRALLEVEFEIDFVKSSAPGASSYGSVTNFDGPGTGSSRNSWLVGAGGKLANALESGRKHKRHLDTCEQCKREHSERNIASLMAGPEISAVEGHNEPTPGPIASPARTHGKDNRRRPHSMPVSLDALNSMGYSNVHHFPLADSRMTRRETLDDFLLEKPFATKGSPLGVDSDRGESVLDVVIRTPALVHEAVFSIEGMTCSTCTGRVNETIEALPFVRSVEVALINNSATVRFEGEKENYQKIVDEVEDIGYGCTLESVKELGVMEDTKAAERSLTIKVDNMFCNHCPSNVLSALEAFAPRLRIDKPLSLADPIVNITYTPAADFTVRQIVASIKGVHPSFQPSIYHPPSIEERSRRMLKLEQGRLYLRLMCCVIIAIPTCVLGVVYMSLVPDDNKVRMYLNEYMWAGKVTRLDWALLFLATTVQFFIADVFHRRAFKDIKGLWRKGSTVPILRRFYRFGSMNLLVSLGVSIAYFASVALVVTAATANSDVHGHTTTYFDSTVFLTMFLLMGRCLEIYSRSKTADAVNMLGKLRPTEALLVAQSSQGGRDDPTDSNNRNDQNAFIEKIPVDLLEAGDLVLIQHGASPPADGKIAIGESKFDESSLTGESKLVAKSEGDVAYAGTINRGKAVHVRVGALAIRGESMLDQIVRVVREGQSRRAPIERIADVVTGYFVPVVTLIAVLTWVIWLALGSFGILPSEWLDTYQGSWTVWSLGFAIAVFVIACPCGIGLAAPTALFVGSGLAAKHGILAKGGGEAFQEASSLDCVVFDKTGTLTQGGEPQVTGEEVYVNGEEIVKRVYGIASRLEENSSHPLARAVVNFCQSKEMAAAIGSDVEEVPGRGVRGTFITGKETYHAIIGNESFIMENGVDALDGSVRETLHKWKCSGKSVVFLSCKNVAPSSTLETFTLWAIFAVMDPIRPEAKHVISSLKKDGIVVYMISGDNPTTALAVANVVGIPAENVIAGVLPTQKAEKIQQLQRTAPKRRRRGAQRFFRRILGLTPRHGTSKQHQAIVAMVGDGVNDAPALTMADVGIAIGSGSDIAISSAKFILLNSDLTSLLTLVGLARKVFRRVKFNFFWACVYNMVALPVAAGAFFALGGKRIRLDPVWASLAMACSSVSVVCSSLLLRSRLPGVGFRTPRFRAPEDEEGERAAEDKV